MQKIKRHVAPASRDSSGYHLIPWNVGFVSHDELTVTGEAIPEQRANTEVACMAKMLIYLVENGLCSVATGGVV